MLRALDGPLGRGVPDGEIGIGADPDHALAGIEAEDPRGILGEHARQPGHGQSAVHDALAVHERDECLERGGAEGNGLALGVDEDIPPSGLLGGGDARRVIARHRRDEALLRSCPQRRPIRPHRRAQRRADLCERAPALHLLVGEEEILRAGLGPHPLPLGLGALDALEAEPGG